MRKAKAFDPLDWLRLGVVLVLVFVAPTLLTVASLGRASDYEHTGWLLRLLWAVPATLLCAALTWPPIWLVCRRSNVRWHAAVFALMFTPVNGFLLAGHVNVRLDEDPGRRVTVPYMRYEKRAKGQDRDVVQSWHDPGATVSLVGAGLRPEQRVPGRPVALTVHRGWLGLEWVDGVRAQ